MRPIAIAGALIRAVLAPDRRTTPRRLRHRRLTMVIPVAALLVAAGGGGRPAEAHDHPACAVCVGTDMRESRVGPWLGVAEQFSRFTTLKRGGEKVGNPNRERLESSITQILLGYTAYPRFSLYLDLPVAHRSYRRLEDEGVRRGSESGVGDLAVLGQLVAWSRASRDGLSRVSLFGGVKFPTGDSGRLREERSHGHSDSDHDHGESHGHDHAGSGIHGHDLSLGSGSFDGIAGGRLFVSRWRAFFAATLRYAVRSEGDFDYRFANELSWSGGPGWLLVAGNEWVLGLQTVFSGETRGKDTLAGEEIGDTGLTALYGGPGLFLTRGSTLGAEIAGDLPVLQNTTGLQIVPDYRVRAGLTWRF